MIDRRSVDVSRAEGLDEHFAGALAVHHCAHGSAYDAKVWRAELPATEAVVLAAAGRAGAVVVFPESLYSYGEIDTPMTEDLPREATRGKLGIRAELLRAREASPTPTVSVAASDFFGPAVRMAHAGERLVPKVLEGKTVNLVGSLEQPHSFTYVPDLARAMITAAAEARAVEHLPARPDLPRRHAAAAGRGAGLGGRCAGAADVGAAGLGAQGLGCVLPGRARAGRDVVPVHRGRSCWTPAAARSCSGSHPLRSTSPRRKPSPGGARSSRFCA